eukprot:3419336-Rhodomonas_salina.1
MDRNRKKNQQLHAYGGALIRVKRRICSSGVGAPRISPSPKAVTPVSTGVSFGPSPISSLSRNSYPGTRIATRAGGGATGFPGTKAADGPTKHTNRFYLWGFSSTSFFGLLVSTRAAIRDTRHEVGSVAAGLVPRNRIGAFTSGDCTDQPDWCACAEAQGPSCCDTQVQSQGVTCPGESE